MHDTVSRGGARAAELQPAAEERTLREPRHAIRTDIQSLRGVAVLLVLAYHGGLGLFRRGFLGVDVFFVISGFLITGMVARDLEAGRFRFRDFYWRRAKRLLPAAYVVLLLTSVAASLLLTRVELVSYLKQLAGALSFTANLVLWRQASYFDEDAALKPLMHTWSLSLEEQFYLVWPLVLWLTPPRWRRPLVVCALLSSALACFALAPAHPTGTFYFLPTRAWELLLGAVGALWFAPAPFGRGRAPRRLAGVVAVLVVIAVPTVVLDPVHPRLDAALVCLATLASIRVRPAILEHGIAARALSRVGDLSYSLYLVHWPILVFIRTLYLETAPALVRVLALLLAVVAAEVLFRTVEDPIRRWKLRPSAGRVALLATASAVIALVPALSLSASRPRVNWAELRRYNFGLGLQCDSGPRFAPTAACRTAEHPRVLVWGDSFAMHLLPGLVATDQGLGLLQATRSACGPTLEVASVENGDVRGAAECLEFNRSVLDFLRRTPEIEYVVLASSLELYVEPGASMLTPSGLLPGRTEAAAEALAHTASAVRAAGRRVVVVGPPPTTGADLGGCVERLRTGLPVAGHALLGDCSIDAAVYREKRRQEIEVVRRVAESTGAGVLRLSDLLCDSSRCRTEDEKTPLYLDYGHLTHAGSELLGTKYALLQRLIAQAR